MTEEASPDDLGKRSAVADDGDPGTGGGAEAAEAQLGEGEGGGNEGSATADMGGGAVGEPIWHDADYIGGKSARCKYCTSNITTSHEHRAGCICYLLLLLSFIDNVLTAQLLFPTGCERCLIRTFMCTADGPIRLFPWCC